MAINIEKAQKAHKEEGVGETVNEQTTSESQMIAVVQQVVNLLERGVVALEKTAELQEEQTEHLWTLANHVDPQEEVHPEDLPESAQETEAEVVE